jgi:hypothetical protein
MTFIGRGKKKDISEENDNEEEGEENEEEEEENDVEPQQSLHHLPLDSKVQQWQQQSSWLFLTWGNVLIRRPGKIWTQFVKDVTGQQTTIGILRKICNLIHF